MSEDDLLKDQRGSPAYISPDVLSGESQTPDKNKSFMFMLHFKPFFIHTGHSWPGQTDGSVVDSQVSCCVFVLVQFLSI